MQTHTKSVETPPSNQDVSLMKEFFGLKCRYEDMSPVLIPAGYTRDYIDGKIAAGEQLKDVRSSFQARDRESDVKIKRRKRQMIVQTETQ